MIADPLAPRAHDAGPEAAEAAEAAEAVEAAKVAEVAEVAKVAEVAAAAEAAGTAGAAGAAIMPSARVPPPATAISAADRRARADTGVLRRARPGPFISLVAPMGGYLQRHRVRLSPRAGKQPGEASGMGAKES